MNSKQLYVNISQIISSDETGWAMPTDFDREAIVHISRASNNNISHITMEFAGIRAKFLSCIIFDGSGNYGTSVHNFAMPRLKLSLHQKALAALSLLQFLIDEGHLDANFDFFREKICSDLNGGVGTTLIKYDRMCELSARYLESSKLAA